MTPRHWPPNSADIVKDAALPAYVVVVFAQTSTDRGVKYFRANPRFKVNLRFSDSVGAETRVVSLRE